MELPKHIVEKRRESIPDEPQNQTLEWVRHRSCCVKVRHATMQAADRQAMLLQKADVVDGEPLGAYYCVFCNDFHIGHSTGQSATRKILLDIERLLLFDFRAPCGICGNYNRFNGLSKKAKG